MLQRSGTPSAAKELVKTVKSVLPLPVKSNKVARVVGGGVPPPPELTLMSSTPTHSSLPAAFVVIILT